MVVFAIEILKLNLERMLKQNIYMRMRKENSIPPCRADLPALFIWKSFILARWDPSNIKSDLT